MIPIKRQVLLKRIIKEHPELSLIIKLLTNMTDYEYEMILNKEENKQALNQVIKDVQEAMNKAVKKVIDNEEIKAIQTGWR